MAESVVENNALEVPWPPTHGWVAVGKTAKGSNRRDGPGYDA